MAWAVISQLLRQQLTAKLSADGRGDALMRCFVLTACDERNGRTATALIPPHVRQRTHAFVDWPTEFWNRWCLYHGSSAVQEPPCTLKLRW